MAGISAVAFDLDGTLLDHRTASSRALAHLARRLGASGAFGGPDLERAWWDAEERHLADWRRGRITFDEQRRRRLRDVLPLLGTGYGTRHEDHGDERLDAIFRIYLLAYEDAWCLFPEVVSVLDAVRSAGLPVGLLTNGTEEQQGRKLEATGIRDRFDVVCTSEALGVAKPDVRAFGALCERLGAPPAEVIFVGDDHTADILGSGAAGLVPFFVDRRGDRQGNRNVPEIGHPDLLPLLPLLV
jgi:putative hydrolase of the HAD superfamily